MPIINKDILKIDHGIITHQVNTAGVMGAGLALSIRKKYPEVYTEYIRLYRENSLHLGTGFIVKISNDLFIFNMICQESYGYSKVYTDYNAMRSSLNFLKIESSKKELPVYIPFKIGCGLGGGDWNVVYKIIEEIIPEAIICKKL
jgi:O-acetyl-ADP-ribose deacetylase (regulator of RNase III)